MKILDFDLEGNHFIIEADISLRQKADDNTESHWPRYFLKTHKSIKKQTESFRHSQLPLLLGMAVN